MTDREYEMIQNALRRHLESSHGYHGNKKEIFNEGIRTAMSIVSRAKGKEEEEK